MADVKAALEGSRDIPENSDPRSQDEEGRTFYLDEDFFGDEGFEEGDKVNMTGHITTIGGKNGVMVEDVKKAKKS